MNIAVKAALLSGFVFPGLGQIYLKQYWRGLIMIILVMLGLIIIVGMATFSALESLKAIQIEGGTVDMNTISNLATTYSTLNDIYYKIIFLLIACCWLFSIVDAFRIGKIRSLGNVGAEKEIDHHKI
jgi:TM2 domain-containing membrane protein YozV